MEAPKKADGKEYSDKSTVVVIHPGRQKATLGQKLADGITYWGGSWAFITSLLVVLFLWILLNTYMLLFGSWDKPPFILLNLILSCLAAIQAPIILMSQNRQMERDRAKAERDFAVNRKAEREITEVQEKLDNIMHLLKNNKK